MTIPLKKLSPKWAARFVTQSHCESDLAVRNYLSLSSMSRATCSIGLAASADTWVDNERISSAWAASAPNCLRQ
jgi:hypothetical protein